MPDHCKFCQHANIHTADCVRNAPGAQDRYNQGYREGRSGKECSSQDPAHLAGWLNGEIALEVAQNTSSPWGE